jgi:hypothetical protein
MSSQPRVVQTGALPANTVKPLEPGSSNVFDSAIQKSNNQTVAQNALIGNNKTGGKKRKSRLRGGAAPLSPAPVQPPVVQVAAAPSYAVNKTETNDINAQIAGLAVSNQNNAAFDATVGGTQADTARIAAEQQAVYSGVGGSVKRRRTTAKSKKGGSWPVWGCLSGGKKSRKTRRSRRKTRKHMKRHRH